MSQDIVGLDVQKIFIPYYTGPYIDHNKHPTVRQMSLIYSMCLKLKVKYITTYRSCVYLFTRFQEEIKFPSK